MSETASLRLQLPGDFLHQAVNHLGPEGSGALHMPGAIPEEFRQAALDEIVTEHVPWRDAGGNYINARGVYVEQYHDVFALKLSRGDQALPRRMRYMKQFSDAVETLVSEVGGEAFPSLNGWTADEMSYHRYYGRDVGLSYHKDNARFTGVVAVGTMQGESDFCVIAREPVATERDVAQGREVISEWKIQSILRIPVKAGSLVLMRGMGLLPQEYGDMRPEHAVENVGQEDRISCMIRANNRPDDPLEGFHYENWQQGA